MDAWNDSQIPSPLRRHTFELVRSGTCSHRSGASSLGNSLAHRATLRTIPTPTPVIPRASDQNGHASASAWRPGVLVQRFQVRAGSTHVHALPIQHATLLPDRLKEGLKKYGQTGLYTYLGISFTVTTCERIGLCTVHHACVEF